MHPFVKIILFFFTLSLMSVLGSIALWSMCLILLSYWAYIDFTSFKKLVGRMKWLFVSIMGIYAFTTPGEYIAEFPVSIAPTIEGGVQGLLQTAKVLSALAVLNLLFATSARKELMSGLYLLLSPLSLMRVDVKKFIARLLLTLDYVEVLALQEKLSFNQWSHLFLTTELYQENKMIELESYPFKWQDKALLTVLALGVLMSLFYGFILR